MIDVAAVAAAVAEPAIILLEADTPHVSSTEIRQRAAVEAPLDGLVPPAVADVHRTTSAVSTVWRGRAGALSILTALVESSLHG